MSFVSHCPNCAGTQFSFENEFKFHCHSCDFVWYHNVAAAVAVIIKNDDKILFTVRNVAPDKGKLDLPGGFVDPDESAAFAACRELHEELGLLIQECDLKFITTCPNTYLYKNVPYKTLDIFFEYEAPSAAIHALALDEIQRVLWINPNDINIDNIGFASIKKVIKEVYVL